MGYEDIINLPHHQSSTRKHMSMHDRAAQFAPFAALKGYDDAVIETGRLTNERVILDDDVIEKLDAKLQYISENLYSTDDVTIIYFKEDQLKSGGSYISKTGPVKKIDGVERKVVFQDGISIPIIDIYDIEICK